MSCLIIKNVVFFTLSCPWFVNEIVIVKNLFTSSVQSDKPNFTFTQVKKVNIQIRTAVLEIWMLLKSDRFAKCKTQFEKKAFSESTFDFYGGENQKNPVAFGVLHFVSPRAFFCVVCPLDLMA